MALNGTGVLAYLDDIIVYGRNFAEHISVLNSVLTHVEKAGLKLMPLKCCLLQRSKVFGACCFAQWHMLQSRKNGLYCERACAYYAKRSSTIFRACVVLSKIRKNFAKIAAPLYDASTTDKRNFKWTENCEQSFSQLKAILTSPPVLKYPDQTKTFFVDCDASNLAIGCVLSQETDGEEHPVAFASRTPNKAERNYSTTRK